MPANPYYPTGYYPQYQPQQTYLPSTQPNLANIAPNRPTPSLSGRVVNAETEITPNEVAMDGSVSVFPLADFSAIVAKQWNANGTISTIKYIPVVDSEEESETDKLVRTMNQRFDELEKRLSNHKPNNRGNNNSRKDNGETNG